MKKISIQDIIKKKFPSVKTKITKESDLLEDNILDSLELMNLISHLEQVSKFKVKNYLKKNEKFIIKKIEKFLS
jgi:acyl carrier protein